MFLTLRHHCSLISRLSTSASSSKLSLANSSSKASESQRSVRLFASKSSPVRVRSHSYSSYMGSKHTLDQEHTTQELQSSKRQRLQQQQRAYSQFTIPWTTQKVEMVPTIELTEQEEKVRSLLVDVAEDIDKHPSSTSAADQDSKLVLRFTGGWVRDKLLNKPSNDLDVGINKMTGFEFASHMTKFLEDNIEKYDIPSRSIHKIEVNPEKSKHLETATTKIMDLDLDFVNLRNETYTEESRIPQMEFGTPYEDAMRRDATINALFYNLHTQEVEDFTELGLADMEAGLIRTPLEPFETFKDDPLRVLRLVRFASRLQFRIVDEVRQAMKNDEIKQALRDKISRERVGVELEKMILGPHPYDSLLLIHELELFDCVFTPLTTSASLANDRVSLLLPAINIARYIFTETNETHMHISKLISDDKDRYIRWILAALSPWEGRAVVEKKKTLQAATVAARDGLKSRTKDCDIISHSYNHANEIHKLVEENSSDKLSELSRLTLGTTIRKLGAEWRLQVFTSLLLNLLPHWSTEVGVLNDDSRLILERYETLLKLIASHDLEDAWNFKPLINGNEMSKLMEKKSGTWMKSALDDVMAWQLEHPAGSKEDAVEYMKSQAHKYQT